MDKQNRQALDWVVPGAQVLLYSTGGASTPHNVKTTTVKKVNKRTFSVTVDREPLFDLASGDASEGGTWGWVRHAVPLDSDTARAELARERRRQARNRVRTVMEAWRREPTRENRLAAIVALEAVEDE